MYKSERSLKECIQQICTDQSSFLLRYKYSRLLAVQYSEACTARLLPIFTSKQQQYFLVALHGFNSACLYDVSIQVKI